MRRRRRPPRGEIEFGFDSFLDLVANVIGIILRLILVAWVGARAYKAIVPPPPPPPAALAEPESLPEPTDPREPLLVARRATLNKQREALARQAEEQQRVASQGRQLGETLAALQARLRQLGEVEKQAKEQFGQRARAAQSLTQSREELQKRSSKLLAEVEALKKEPVRRKELRYLTPVSAPVQTEEVMFECKHGRVTLIDTGAMLAEIRREARGKSEALRTRWQVTEMTSPVGAFRLRYVLERERSVMDGPGSVAPVDGTFRYGLTSWEVVPLTQTRGETAEQALARGSGFRKLVDALDPQQTVVTLWVYPDSFSLYRELRDYLHRKNVVVAGRPLPEEVPIASSRHGSLSRGQ